MRQPYRDILGSGDSDICVAVLDGPVDQNHPSLVNAHLDHITPIELSAPTNTLAYVHGTHIASLIFGQPATGVEGVAPRCRGILIPIFRDGKRGLELPSQIELAHAITLAVEAGANIINISAGERAFSTKPHPLLSRAIDHCVSRSVLVIAATGNDGQSCITIPAALPDVLAVGALQVDGSPLPSSNWGPAFANHGITAIGSQRLGAVPGGTFARRSGSSFAAAIVAGGAALLLTLQVRLGQKVDPIHIRNTLITTADPCAAQDQTECARLLAGRFNLLRAATHILAGGASMKPFTGDEPASFDPQQSTQLPTESGESAFIADYSTSEREGGAFSADFSSYSETETAPMNSISNAQKGHGCGCKKNGQECSCNKRSQIEPSLVYALGRIGYDFGTEARLDSIRQQMEEGAHPANEEQFLRYLEDNPWDAASVIWTLNLDQTPIYALVGGGPFAREIYERLREFLNDQIREGVERVSIPGVIVGETRLLSGQRVPLVLPELRGMASWTTSALIESVLGGQEDSDNKFRKQEAIAGFLERVYYEVRNLGLTPEERAMNFAATNAFNLERIYENAVREDMDLDSIEVERSPVCRPDSDCWDVRLIFFYPQRQVQTVRRVYRFTVDVSDVVPVTVGAPRAWFIR